MNYREKLRKAIECPQFGNTNYGEWGALRLDQRKYIKRLLDELDGADAYSLQLYEENKQLKEQLEASEKARKILKEINEYRKETGGYPSEMLDKLLDILDIDKGEMKDE